MRTHDRTLCSVPPEEMEPEQGSASRGAFDKLAVDPPVVMVALTSVRLGTHRYAAGERRAQGRGRPEGRRKQRPVRESVRVSLVKVNELKVIELALIVIAAR